MRGTVGSFFCPVTALSENPVNKWLCKWNPGPLLHEAQTLFMGFCAYRDLPLEIKGGEREVCFLFLARHIDAEAQSWRRPLGKRLAERVQVDNKRPNGISSSVLGRRPFLRCRWVALCAGWSLNVSVSVKPTTSALWGPRQKPRNHSWGGISERASTRTARLSLLWKGQIYWRPESILSLPCTLSNLLRDTPAL